MIRVQLSRAARKDLDKLDDPTARRILDKLTELESHPEPTGLLRKLRGYDALYRLRAGEWRVVGELSEPTFRVVMVGHRRAIYRRLARQSWLEP